MYTLLLELASIVNEANFTALTNSSEFKAIQQKDENVADLLKLQWGYPEYILFTDKILTGVKNRDSEFKEITPDIILDLTRLLRIHNKQFPNAAFKAAEMSRTQLADANRKAGIKYKWDEINSDTKMSR